MRLPLCLLLAWILLAAVGPMASAQAPSPPPPKSPRADHDALTAARFELSIDGVAIASFSELVSLSRGFDPSDLDLTAQGVVASRLAPPSVTLKRGVTRSSSLQEWFEAAMQGEASARKSCSLTMYNTKGDPVAQYHLENAWPAKIEIGSLKAGSSEVLIETVVFVAEHIRELAR